MYSLFESHIITPIPNTSFQKENEGILMVNFFTGFVTSQKTSAVDDVIGMNGQLH